jgi:CheY-like chemotaxis protein/two-component sensor histidine kinase
MNSILGFTALLLDEIDDEQHSKFLKIINNSGNHLLSLINDILDISKIQSGNIKLHYTNCNINKLIKRIIDEQKLAQNNNAIEIIFNKQDDLILYCDKTRVKQIIINLLSNAIKYTQEGHIKVSYQVNDNNVIFSVEDTGKGIDIEAQNYIFDRFRQVDNSITRKFDGAGLGLAITKSLIELHKGEIWIESKIGKGSTFYFSLPNKVNSKEEESKSKKKSLNLIIKNKNILIAEDNIDNYIYLETLLNPKFNKITHAENGIEALKTLKEKKFDIIFMDIQMPLMDGLSCSTYIREQNIDTPIVAQTAFAMEEDRALALNSGCNYYISKPIKKDELNQILTQVFSTDNTN